MFAWQTCLMRASITRGTSLAARLISKDSFLVGVYFMCDSLTECSQVVVLLPGTPRTDHSHRSLETLDGFGGVSRGRTGPVCTERGDSAAAGSRSAD